MDAPHQCGIWGCCISLKGLPVLHGHLLLASFDLPGSWGTCAARLSHQLGSPHALRGKAWPGAEPALHAALLPRVPALLAQRCWQPSPWHWHSRRRVADDLTDGPVSLSLCPRSADHSLPGSSVSTDFGSWQMVTGCGSIREQATLSADASLPCSFPDEFPNTCL